MCIFVSGIRALLARFVRGSRIYASPIAMGKRGPQPKKPPPPAPLKAKGKGPQKRTPTSAFDAAAKDDDVYQCERIVGKRLASTLERASLHLR